jgi:hypothetical protein
LPVVIPEDGRASSELTNCQLTIADWALMQEANRNLQSTIIVLVGTDRTQPATRDPKGLIRIANLKPAIAHRDWRLAHLAEGRYNDAFLKILNAECGLTSSHATP